MIFDTTILNQQRYKAQFIELIMVYIRLTEVFAQKHSYKIPSVNASSPEVLEELEQMGVLTNTFRESDLQKTIGSTLCSNLYKSVSFYLKHRNEFGDLLDKLSNTKRKLLQEESLKSGKPTYVDFFAGAGGLSLGFSKAGYRVVLANDFEEVCVETYKYNHPELPSKKVIETDIRKIVNNIDNYISEPIDIVVGGPPCQGFSSANKQRVIDDPRNELYKYYIEAIKKILPKFVIMENVRGMLPVANQVVEDYENIREERNGIVYTYTIAYKLLHSEDFSVAQARERLIYIAIRNDIAQDKKISPLDIFKQIEDNNKNKQHFLLKDALDYIKPLSAPRIKNQNEVDTEECGKKIDVNLFQGNENDYLKLINGNRIIPFIFNHKARYVNDINYEIYRLLEQGEDATDPKIAHIMPYANRNHCFKDKYYKLIANRPSRTITAHLRMDCHSHIHPFQIRAITPREAARCQSFPDDYLFLGAYLKTYMQIGNAVPVIMAKGIAEVIKKYL